MRNPNALVTGVAVILGCQAVGTLVQIAAEIKVPGPVIGFFLLWGALTVGLVPLHIVEDAADLLLSNLLLLFTPVVVGALPYLPLLENNLFALISAVVVGTTVTIAVTGWLAQWLLLRENRATATNPPNQEGS